MDFARRKLFTQAGVAGATALATYSHSALADSAVQTPFKVSATTIPIVGSNEVFPVRRIYCIGRNYEAHAREMGSDPTREPPFFFQKPTDAIQFVPIGQSVNHPYPPLTKNYHHEIELVAALSKGGRNIAVEKALEYVTGATPPTLWAYDAAILYGAQGEA